MAKGMITLFGIAAIIGLLMERVTAGPVDLLIGRQELDQISPASMAQITEPVSSVVSQASASVNAPSSTGALPDANSSFSGDQEVNPIPTTALIQSGKVIADRTQNDELINPY
jgi:hypothetical protein